MRAKPLAVGLTLMVLLAAILSVSWLLKPDSPPPPTYPTPEALTPATPVQPHSPAAPVNPVPVAPAPASVPAPAPASAAATEWKLVDARKFVGTQAPDSYHPFYVIESQLIGAAVTANDNWHISLGNQGDEMVYQPRNEALLEGSYAADSWIRLARQTPHTVKWEVTLTSGSGIKLEDDGAVVMLDADEDALPTAMKSEHTIVLERVGGRLTLTLDGGPSRQLAVSPQDRLPLRVVAQRLPVVLRSSRLYFGQGETFSPPPPPPAEGAPPRWARVAAESFDTEAALKWVTLYPADGALTWNAQDRAMVLDALVNDRNHEAYALIHRSLPGDLRLSFRARTLDPDKAPFFGLVLALKGTLKKEDAYFVEWRRNAVQIKRRNSRVAGKDFEFPAPGADRWVQFRVERIGGKISLFTNDAESLTWTDPRPLTGADYDLCAFYLYHAALEIDDLIFERNQLDPVQPHADDPATEANYLQGQRETPDTPPNRDEF